MLGTYYYHEIIRKTIVSFGTLFNAINIRHDDVVFIVWVDGRKKENRTKLSFY